MTFLINKLKVSRGSFLSYFRSSDTTHSYCKLTFIGSPTTTRTQTKRVRASCANHYTIGQY
nr:MAG TPA: Transcriptional regulator [Caudoviricetes sp.]